MKKLILCAAAAAAMAGAGPVMAQTAECAVGILGAYTGDPCPNGQPRPQPRNQDQNRGGHDYRYGADAAILSQILGGNAYPYAYHEAPRVVPRYEPSRRDRDGDGVRNRNDRHPNDPRYR